MILKRILMHGIACMCLLAIGCSNSNPEEPVETVVVSDTAADALLMDVEGLEDLDEIDALIEELSLLQEANDAVPFEPTESLDEPPVVDDSPSVVEAPVVDATPEVEQPADGTETTEPQVQERKYVGQITGILARKIVVEIVRINQIDKAHLEELTPAERRQALQDSIMATGKFRTLTVNEDTEITINRKSASVDALRVGQIIQVITDGDGQLKAITGINLR